MESVAVVKISETSFKKLPEYFLERLLDGLRLVCKKVFFLGPHLPSSISSAISCLSMEHLIPKLLSLGKHRVLFCYEPFLLPWSPQDFKPFFENDSYGIFFSNRSCLDEIFIDPVDLPVPLNLHSGSDGLPWVDGWKFAGYVSLSCESLAASFEQEAGFEISVDFSQKILIPLTGPSSASSLPSRSFPKIKPCLFLDRDGVLNVDTGYPHQLKDLKVFPEAKKLIAHFQKKGFFIAVVSNQSGFARGRFKEKEFQIFLDALKEALSPYQKAISLWLHCPYHPEAIVAQYKALAHSRKPGLGMVFEVASQLPIDLSRSVMVGDKLSDQLMVFGGKNYLIGKIDESFVDPQTKVFPNHAALLEFIMVS